MNIIVASKNPVKIDAARRGVAALFPDDAAEIEGVSVPSGVGDQPMSDAETRAGAKNRADNAAAGRPDADFWIGIEGGIEDAEEGMRAFAWVVIRSADGTYGYGKTGVFLLPPPVADLIRHGKELGEADDIVFGRTNSKQENGAVGILTGNAIDRTIFYRDATILALIPFKNLNLYTGR